MRRTRGFTLIEVLVALAAMALLAALAWRGIDAMLHAGEGSRGAVERTARIATVVAQWEQDLAALYDTGAVPAIAFDGQTLRLTRSTPTGIVLVAWSLRSGRWLRWASPALVLQSQLQEAWMRSQQLQGQEPEQVLLEDDVSEWQLYYWRGNAWTNAQSSAEEVVVPAPDTPGSGADPAPRRTRSALPEGVRLVVTLPSGKLTRDVELTPQVAS